MKRDFKQEYVPLLEVLAAIILGVILIPLGIVWNFFKPFYNFRGHKFEVIMKKLGWYWLKLLYQVWNVVKYALHHTAVAIDLFGNVVAGDFIEDMVTHKENTWYGNGKVTVSAATGQLEHYDKLNKTGKWLTRMLSKFFEKNHSIIAYEKEKLEIARLEEIERQRHKK